MKKLSLLFIALFASLSITAQEKKIDIYGSFSLEMIFSFATIDNQGNTEGNIMRWAPVINPQTMLNVDFGKNFGLFSGLAIRNVGFIYENPFDENNAKYKYRTYNLGIPLGFKVGKLNDIVFFAGYEMEFPFVYKEKQFINEEKENKDAIWFSNRVEAFQQSVLAGVQLPLGFTVKFKYYLSNFHNRDYVAMVDGQETLPYDFKSNVIYFSLAWKVFSNWKELEPKEWDKKAELR